MPQDREAKVDPLRCQCGETHHRPVTEVVLHSGAVRKLPLLLKTPGTITVLSDRITHSIAGAQIAVILRAIGREVGELILESTDFDEIELLDKLTHGTSPAYVLGVGTGTINDIGKYIAWRANCAYCAIPTAPSMDGFASALSALSIRGLKVTVKTKEPELVVGDLDFLRSSPQQLISAGFGDLVGKFTSLRDWETSSVLFQESWCPVISGEVERVIHKIFECDRIDDHEQFTENLTRGLIDVGLATVKLGNSRPTSGSEHLISHYIEMRARPIRGTQGIPHGHSVGVATVLACKLVEVLRNTRPRNSSTDPIPDLEDVLRSVGFETRPDNIGLTKFNSETSIARHHLILERWGEILQILHTVPLATVVARKLARVGCPVSPKELGFDRDFTRDMLFYSRFLRERYTLLDIAADLGVLTDAVDGLLEEYY